MQKKEYYPNIIQSILIGLFYYANIILVFSIGHNFNQQILLEIGSISGFFVIILCIKTKYVLNITNLFNNIHLSLKLILPLLLIFLGITILDFNFFIFISSFISIPDVFQGSLWHEILGSIILIPIIEELLFRGIILKGFLKRYSPIVAILLSALLFALFHGNVIQLLSVFIKGILFGILFFKTKSIYPSIFAHIINNLIVIVSSNFDYFVKCYTVKSFTSLSLIFMSILSCFLGVILLLKIFKSNTSI